MWHRPGYAHRLVDLLRRQLAVDLLHGIARALHGGERLTVDIGGLDGVYLLLECSDLRVRLLQAVLVNLLAPERRLGRYRATGSAAAAGEAGWREGAIETIPFLLELTCLRARASCSSICVSRCFFRFCSISSCDRSPRIAFLGLSLRLCAAPPPNQPHMLMTVLYSRLLFLVGE